MTDSYDEQLSAARYRAERDQARQELARLRGEATTMSAYDLLPDDDRELLWWAHSVGGMDEVCSRYREADYRRVELCSALGIDAEAGWSDAMAEMSRRLMPEGMEWLLEVWPRWSNGEYCRFGDWWTARRYGHDEPKHFRKLSIYTPEQLAEWEQDDGESYGYEWDFVRPSELGYRPDKVEPPAPKVLAADGEPLEAGQTVWHVATGREYTVRSCTNGGAHLSRDGRPAGYCRAEYLTHRRPVLDADGAPIKKGDTVWYRMGAAHGVVESIDANSILPLVVYRGDGGELYRDAAKDVTHIKPEPPDSAERIAEDIRRMAEEWCSCPSLREASEKAASSVGEATMGVALSNLSKRCRALAERERGRVMNREYVCIAVPSIDAGESLIRTDYIQREEVVRCRDCRNGEPFCDSSSYAGMIDCLHFAQWDGYNDEPGIWPVEPDGFCAWGEGREG